jgi:hypothetical protein
MKFLGMGFLALALLVAGCGATVVKSDAVIEALDLSKPKNRNTYAVAGDPFCEIRTTILTNEDEVRRARKRKGSRKLLVTNPTGTVGVIGISPFESDCRAQVEQGLQAVE